ncbi:ABC transporter substrate-binding protein [Roseovarius sp. MMSF_3281]|uniref:ABC transporter substrate-binding protein n=1 Tax=Roseovarius sp. MMSF_3281 TaxID=3046694 RepID=UPI00273E7572|nr:ABC transporter substrate-binding protein [Roseovarius sp. MMSF_3281]
MKPICLALVMMLAGAAMAQPLPEAVESYGPADAERRLLVRGTTDIARFEAVMQIFTSRPDAARIDYEQWASNDLFQVTLSDCQKGMQAADMVISSAVDLQFKLANDGCARAHRSAATEGLPQVANWREEVFGITRELAVIVYNKRLIDSAEVPLSRFDLIDLLRPDDSRFRGRVATYDIEASGLGYLFAFADAQQATTFGSLIEAFGRSGAVATCCSDEIIDGVADGTYLIAYNVLGSYALARAAQNPDIVAVAPEDYTLVLARAALIPRHAAEPELAGAFLDFLLSEAGQSALTSSHLIVSTDDGGPASLRLPESAETSLRPIALTPSLLVGLDQHKRRDFIALWRSTFPNESDDAKAAPE